jgi:hypothetical protein
VNRPWFGKVLPLLGAAMVIGSVVMGNKEDIGDWAEAAW